MRNPTDNITNIQLISSPVLQQQLFKLHAPSLEIDWKSLPKASSERAAVLNAEMSKLNEFAVDEHDTLCTVLATIALIASDAEHTAYIVRRTEQIGLGDKLKLFNFGVSRDAMTTANVAAWVNVHSLDAGISDNKRAGLSSLWQQLQIMSEHISQSGHHYSFDLDAHDSPFDKINERIANFKDNLQEHWLKLTSLKSFPIAVSFAPHGAFVRFTVNMPKYPIDSLQSEDEKIYLDRDRNMTGCTIDYYPSREYVVVSRFVDKPTTRDIADRFAKHILRTVVPDRKKNHYPLTIFRDRRYKSKLLLPPSAARGDRVWISALDCAYYATDGTLLSICNEHSCEDDDIHGRIDIHHPSDLYPYDKREVRAVELSFELHEQLDIGAKDLTASKKTRRYRYTFTPTGPGSYARLRKVTDDIHRGIIKATLNSCGLLGMSLSQLQLFLSED